MDSPASFTRIYLSPLNYLWNSRCYCLIYRALSFCVHCSAAHLSDSHQVYWEIQYTRAFVGSGVLSTSPLILVKSTLP